MKKKKPVKIWVAPEFRTALNVKAKERDKTVIDFTRDLVTRNDIERKFKKNERKFRFSFP